MQAQWLQAGQKARNRAASVTASTSSVSAPGSVTVRQGSDKRLPRIDGLELAINFTINETY